MTRKLLCKWCKSPIEEVPGHGGRVYVVSDSGTTTADGLTYCPPNPDHIGTFRDHAPYADRRRIEVNS